MNLSVPRVTYANVLGSSRNCVAIEPRCVYLTYVYIYIYTYVCTRMYSNVYVHACTLRLPKCYPSLHAYTRLQRCTGPCSCTRAEFVQTAESTYAHAREYLANEKRWLNGVLLGTGEKNRKKGERRRRSRKRMVEKRG